jgi:hypothetical protein
MMTVFGRRLHLEMRTLLVAGIVLAVLALAAAIGLGLSRSGRGESMVAVTLLLVGGGILLLKPEVGVLLLCGLSNLVYFNLTVFDVRGREISMLHLLAAGLIAAWLVRQVVVERRLAVPRTALNAPLLFLVVVWLVTWLAGYAFWDRRVPTTHRQLLFFVTEVGQMLLFTGVFWVVVGRIRSRRWIEAAAATLILANAATFIWAAVSPNPADTGMWNMMQMAVALAYAWLTEPSTGPRDRLWLGLALAILVLGIIPVRRIPIYAATAATVLAIAWFRSRRSFVLGLVFTVLVAATFIVSLWQAEASVDPRFELAEAAWAIFADHPILGVGPTHYRSYAILYHPVGWRTVESGMLLPHDVWLYHLANTGVAGGLAILWLVVAMALAGFRAWKTAPSPLVRTMALAGLGSMAGVIVQSVGGHFPFVPSYSLGHMYMVGFWIVQGLLFASLRLEDA